MITFNTIPINIRTPGQYIEFDNTRAVQGLPAIVHKILVIGQRLATGSVAQAIPKLILSSADAELFFGRGSQLALMLRALKKANTYTQCFAVALDDNGAGVFAAGSIAFTGPATQDGTLSIYIGGQLLQVAVTNTQTAAAIATAVAAAINAQTDLPLTAAAVAAAVNLTARNKGENGNYIDVRFNYQQNERLPNGVGVVIVAMAAGATNPDVQTAITAIGAEQYHTIITSLSDATNLGKIETELSLRWGPMVQKEGQAFAGISGTVSAIDTFGATRNSQFVSIMSAQKSPTPPWIIAAIVGAIDAFEPDPARPRQTLQLPGVLAPAEQDRYLLSERNLLLQDGISTFVIDAGGNVLIERLITTYQTLLGVDDISYLDIETMRTIAFLRFSVRSRIALKFPRYKLANDGTRFGPGQPIVTPKVIRAELVALARAWEDAGLVENLDQFKADLIVERSGTDPNRVDAIIPPDIINQFRVFAGQVQFRL